MRRIVFIGKLLKIGLYSKQHFRKMHSLIIILTIGGGGGGDNSFVLKEIKVG
jgi:hypothetical protein